MKKIIAVLLCFLLAGCSEVSETFEAMDTLMTITAYGKNAKKAVGAVKDEILALDNMFRRKSEGSDIFKINENGSADVSEDTAELILRSAKISEETDGAFDITVAPVVDLWGFYDSKFRVPEESEIQNALKSVGYKNISVNGNSVSVKNSAKLDLGGIAKGYASDRAAKIFRDFNVNGILSLGGNIYAMGKRQDGENWTVAIQNPDNDGYIGTVSVSDTAVITSGSYQRYFECDGKIYHHIIDPKTGSPADSGLKSVTIVTDNGTLGDSLSTALFVMGKDRAAEYQKTHNDFDMILIDNDGEVYYTEGLDGVFTPSDGIEAEILK